MKVKFLGHACLYISDIDNSFVLDPYLEKSSWSGQLYVTETANNWQEYIKKSDVIVFSHAHDDHYNEGMIKPNWDLFEGKTILIPKFKARFFPQRLKDIGFANIIEIDEGETVAFGSITVSVAINDADMDSSWFFENSSGKSILAQTDNLDLESLNKFSGKVDVLWYMYGQTGIFPTFLDVSFEEKVRLLDAKRNSWYGKLRSFISQIKPKYAYGYASDMYYGHAFEANLVEASLDYPPDLLKAAPGFTIDLDSSDVDGEYLSKNKKLSRLYDALARDKSDIAAFQRTLVQEEIKLNEDEISQLFSIFIDNLSKSCCSLEGVVNCQIELIELSGNVKHSTKLALGKPHANETLNMSLTIPLVYLSLLSQSRIEMGAIALWNGAISFLREDPDVMSGLERGFWRSFRRMPYY
jgi:L-ascorbate metabolism protein UlaG (beta-lactamase superfamily)